MLSAVINNWQSILFYLAVFCISSFFIYIGNKKSAFKRYIKLIFLVLGLAMPVFIASIRYGIGHDYFNYVGMIERVQVGQRMWPRSIEPLSSLVINFSANLGGSVTMFALFSALTIVFAYLAIKKLSPKGAKFIALSWLSYLCVIFPTTLFTVRSGLAVSVAMYALSWIIDIQAKHRLTKFVCWIIVASLFHVSALICLPIGLIIYYVNRNGRIDVKMERIALGIAIMGAVMLPLYKNLVGIVPIDIISSLSRYLIEVGGHYYVTISSIAVMAILFFTLIINGRATMKDIKLRTLYSLVAYYIPISIMIGWLSYYATTSRLAFYLDPIALVVLVYAIKQSEHRLVKGRRIGVAVLILALTFNVTMFVRNSYWAANLPYRTIFFTEQIHVDKN